MRVVSLKCPDCGASLQPPEPSDVAVCEYCGSRSSIERARGSDERGPEQSHSPREDRSRGSRALTFITPHEPELKVAADVIKVGSHASAHVRLQHETVERMHAVIEVSDDAVVLIDLGSDAGTTVNGRAVLKTTLESGDSLRFGESEVHVVSFD